MPALHTNHIPTFNIRLARLSDLHALNRVKTGAAFDMIAAQSRVARQLYGRNPKHWYGSPKRWRGTIVAQVNGRIVGVVQTHGAKLSDLWVERSERSKGIGAMLLRAGENRIRAHGHRFTHLYTAIFNARGRVFYERNGWTLTSFTHHRVCHFRRCVYVKRL